MGLFQGFDVYAKTQSDVLHHSISGGIATVCCALCMLTLLASEIASFMHSETVVHDLIVDPERGGKLIINFNISFEHLPCSVLAVDGKDTAGEYELSADSVIWKHRYTPDGAFIATEKQEDTDRDRPPLQLSMFEGDGFMIFGGFTLGIFGGSNDSAKIEEQKKRLQERCTLVGQLHVNKVAGNFHITMHGQNFHVMHSLFPGMHANMSHVINQLSFGQTYPGQINPLDHEVKIMKNKSMTHGMYEYFVKVVPTVYQPSVGSAIVSNQYSATDYFKRSHFGYPEIGFNYELWPLMVTVSEGTQSLPHFITKLCAILGGIYIVHGRLHSLFLSLSGKNSKPA